MRSLIFCTAQPKFTVNKIERNEIVGACRVYGGWYVVYWVLVGNTRVKISLWGLRVNGMIIKKLIFRNWDVVLWTGSSCLMIRKFGGHF